MEKWKSDPHIEGRYSDRYCFVSGAVFPDGQNGVYDSRKECISDGNKYLNDFPVIKKETGSPL